MIFSAFTDIGKVRKQNEDSFYVPNSEDNIKLFLVADGIGGQSHGKLASMMSVDEIVKYLVKNYENNKNAEQAIYDAIKTANDSVFEVANSKAEFSGMGTTLVAALIKENKLFLTNAGDSRCYIIRKNIISQLTVDNSYVQYLIEQGVITTEEAQKHPQRNLITKAIGLEKDIDIDIECIDVYPKDIILLCTDGLTTMLSDEEILNIVIKENGNIEETTKALVKHAKDKGGLDNITAILVEV